MAKTLMDEVDFSLIQQFIETGNTANLPDEVVRYLEFLELVRVLLLRETAKENIIKLLKSPPYNLTDYSARQRVFDAINFFYRDNAVKRDAWRGLYADKLDRIALTMLQTGKNVRDLKEAASVLVEAAKIRGVFEPEPDVLPEELFKNSIRIYTTDISQLGRERANRHELARMIDSYEIDEVTRQRLRQEAMIVPPRFLTDNNTQP